MRKILITTSTITILILSSKCKQCQTSVPVAPIVYSPEGNKINGTEEVAKSSDKQQKRRQAGRKQMEKMQKHQKTVVNHPAVDLKMIQVKRRERQSRM